MHWYMNLMCIIWFSMYHEFLKIVIMYQTISLIHKYSVCYSVLVDALIHELDVYHMISYVSRVFEIFYHVSVINFNNCHQVCLLIHFESVCIVFKMMHWYMNLLCIIMFSMYHAVLKIVFKIDDIIFDFQNLKLIFNYVLI